ncbi:MAG: hypothetical protein QXM22_06335, partial [Candidatus Bathyarchaeia archaeon]
KKIFRGAIYDITIKNPKGKNRGVKYIKVDGKKQFSSVVLPFKDRKTLLLLYFAPIRVSFLLRQQLFMKSISESFSNNIAYAFPTA